MASAHKILRLVQPETSVIDVLIIHEEIKKHSPDIMTRNNAELRVYYSLRNSIRCWLLFCGLWPVGKSNIFYRIWSHLSYTCNIFFAIALFRFAVVHITNVYLVVKGISLGTSFVSIAFKVSRFTFYREKLNEIYAMLNSYQEESIKDVKLHGFVVEKMPGFRRLYCIFSVLVAMGCAMYAIPPIIFIIIQLFRHVETLKYVLPTPAVYPWHIHPGGLLYKVTYIFEIFNFLCLLTVTCGVDSFFGYCILIVIGQLRILGHQMMNFQDINKYDELIKDTITKYLFLKKSCETLEKIYGPLILWMIVTNSVIICTVFFQISQQTSISFGKYMLIAGYAGSKVLQTYMYAQAGSALTAESENFMESVYFSNWQGAQRQRFRTSVLIMLSQKPMTFQAMNCLVISNDVFVTTLNTTISYFFLLKTVEEK